MGTVEGRQPAELRTAVERTVGYRGTERLSFIRNPTISTVGAVPVVYCHGFLGTGISNLSSPAVWFLQHIVDAGMPVILADYGGGTTWGNDDIVDPGNAIDDALVFCNTRYGTKLNKVIAAGESMGSIAAAGWAWRNLARTALLWRVAPIVDMLAFYNANPIFQAAMDSAYTNHAGFLAALATHDASLNTALLLHLAGRSRLDYSLDDELIDPNLVVTHAKATGAEWYGHGGGHADLYTTVDGGEVAQWMSSHVERWQHT